MFCSVTLIYLKTREPENREILHKNPKPMTKQTEMCVLLYLGPLKAVNAHYEIIK